jgi:hypothetical protein
MSKRNKIERDDASLSYSTESLESDQFIHITEKVDNDIGESSLSTTELDKSSYYFQLDYKIFKHWRDIIHETVIQVTCGLLPLSWQKLCKFCIHVLHSLDCNTSMCGDCNPFYSIISTN